MIARFGYNKYNPCKEGTNHDIQQKAIELDCNIDDFEESNQHHIYFPMPFINLFDARFDNTPTNNIIRFVFIKIFSKKKMTANQLFTTMDKLSIPHNLVEETFNLFRNKYYIIDKEYEYVGDENIPIRLTRRGEVMFEISSWPRYLNIIMSKTHYKNNDIILSQSDHDSSNVVKFIETIRDQEISFYNDLNDSAKETYNQIFSLGNFSEYPIASFLSIRYFSCLISELRAMFFSVNPNATFAEIEDLENACYSVAEKKFGYLKKDIVSIKSRKPQL